MEKTLPSLRKGMNVLQSHTDVECLKAPSPDIECRTATGADVEVSRTTWTDVEILRLHCGVVLCLCLLLARRGDLSALFVKGGYLKYC